MNVWFQFDAQAPRFPSILSFDTELKRAKLYV